MNETVEMWVTFIFLMAISTWYILAGIFKWREPQAFIWESATDSQKPWIRIIKIIFGVIIIIPTLIGLFEKLF